MLWKIKMAMSNGVLRYMMSANSNADASLFLKNAI